MLRPARMRKLTVGVHRSRYESCIALLQEAGAVELDAVDDVEGLQALIGPHTQSARTPAIAEARVRLERCIEAVEFVLPKQNAVAGIFFPATPSKVTVGLRGADEVLEDVERLHGTIDTVLALKKRETAIAERLDRIAEEEEMLGLLLPFGIDLAWIGSSPLLQVRAGAVPAGECEDIEAHLTEFMPDLSAWFCLCGIGGRPTAILTAAHPAAAEAVDAALRPLAFREFVPETTEGTAEEGIARISDERRALLAEREEIVAHFMDAAATHLPALRALAEELAVLREREEAARLMGNTNEMTVLHGWVREDDAERVASVCERAAGGLAFCIFEPPDNTAPVAFDHPRWLAPFGFLTSTFGTPAYGSVDPTIFLAPVLVFTFGIMLGDAGYGVILTLFAALILRGAGRTPGTVRDLALVLVACGVSGTVFGLLMNGFFGDLLPRFFGMQVPFAVIEPLKDPISILIFALGIGIAHLNLGLLIAAYEHLRTGNLREMILSEGVWFVIQPCAAVLIMTFFGWLDVTPTVTSLAWAGAAVGIAGLMIHEGPLGFFSLTGFLGDWLSYVRILALALATGGIAMMINILAGMIAAVHPALVVLAVLFAVVGHVGNLAIQSLGGFIHALRLQYVEFFGKFFRSGGRPFRPFAARRTFTEVSGGDE
ncbi:MAG: V/A-type H+/Na+-transporting ATPase subunit [Methanofollis sp.]|nr:V/A-type H+/Na+-transporting ATPase subunit [Methanofollis sp.]